MASRLSRDKETAPERGLGALCAEAQADGVPCTEVGKDCEKCERAVESRRARRRSKSKE